MNPVNNDEHDEEGIWYNGTYMNYASLYPSIIVVKNINENTLVSPENEVKR